MSLILFLILILHLTASSPALTPVNKEKKLREDLFSKRGELDVNLRPVEYFNQTLSIEVGLLLKHVTEVNVKEGYAVFNCWIRLTWNDHTLKWNEEDYGGIKHISIPPNLIWKPDLTLYNHAMANHAENYGQTLASLYNSGLIHWAPPVTVFASCSFQNIEAFPFDEHVCFLKFGSWTYDGFMVDLKLETNNSQRIKTYTTRDHHEWKITDITAQRNEKYYSCCLEPYPDITFSFTLKRESHYYTSTLLMPSIFVMIFILITFWLPPTANEKLILNVLNLIYIIILIIQLLRVFSGNSINTPGIVIFCCSSLILAGIALILCIVTYNLSNKRHITSPPDFVMKILNGRLSCLCCLPRANKENVESNLLTSHDIHDNLEIPEGEAERNPHDEWLTFAIALDRSFFYCYSLVFIVLLAYSFS